MANEKRLIDANELWHKTFICEDAADVRKFIENAPTVGAVEVVHGQWHEDLEDVICSECCSSWNIIDNCTETFNYCPNCGAKMDGDENV